MTDLHNDVFSPFTDELLDSSPVTLVIDETARIGETVRVQPVTVPAKGKHGRRGGRRQRFHRGYGKTPTAAPKNTVAQPVDRQPSMYYLEVGMRESADIYGLPVYGLPEVTEHRLEMGVAPTRDLTTVVVRRRQHGQRDVRVEWPEQLLKQVAERMAAAVAKFSPLTLRLQLATPSAPLQLTPRTSVQTRYSLKEQFYGQVREVNLERNVFVAWLTEREAGLDRWETEIELSELKPKDRAQLRAGRLFVWAMGQHDVVDEAGEVVNRLNESQFFFRPMPVVDEAAADVYAKRWKDKFLPPSNE